MPLVSFSMEQVQCCFPELQAQVECGDVTSNMPQQMLACTAGIQRQLSLCSNGGDSTSNAPRWCSNAQLTSDLQTSLATLFGTVNAHSDDKFAEVFSWTHVNGSYISTPLADLSPTSTESDAFQLWSYGFLSVKPSSASAAA